MLRPLHRLIGLLPTLALLLVVLCHASNQPLEPYLADSLQHNSHSLDSGQDPEQDHDKAALVAPPLALTRHIPSSIFQGGLSNRTPLRCRSNGAIRAPPSFA